MSKCYEVWYHMLYITTKVVYASILMAMRSAKAAFVGSDLLLLSWATHEIENIIIHDDCTLHTCLKHYSQQGSILLP